MTTKILITASTFGKEDDAPLQAIVENGLSYLLNPFKRKLAEAELIDLLAEHRPTYLIAGIETISRSTLSAAKSYLKIISRCGVGTDNIDLNAAQEFGIKIFNTPDAPTQAVAELTIGVALSLLRGISKSDRNIRAGKFDKHMGVLFCGKTIGVVGCGRIGSRVAKLAEALGANVIGYDKYAKERANIDMRSFDELLAIADIVSLHMPYTKEDRHIINADAIAKMKRGAILLNISRGGLIDEEALCAALKGGFLSGAGLDCFETEPYIGELIKLENVVLTAHIGSYAKEARLKQERDAVQNILENR
jgi:D-3-phosphoglycerate dehydrogenase